MPWVFANTGIVEAYDGSVWFAGVGTTAKLYRYDARLNDEVGQGTTFTDFKSAAGQKQYVLPYLLLSANY